MTTIKLKNGSGAPLATDLVQGEVALDLTNKRIYSENASGVVVEMGTSPSTIDINAGTIDGVTMATSDITVGAGKTLDVSAGTLTLANDQISGDKVQGGTIGSTTITTLTSTTGNITTVNATTVDTTNIEVTNVKAKDGTASATIADSTGVMTIASSVLTTTDINSGTIDGVTIGGASAGAITGTTITGTSFVSSGNMTFGDNDKAIFGAGSDLQIFHDNDGSTEGSVGSYIKEGGTGDLRIRASNLQLQTALGERYLTGTENSATTIYYDDSAKLATTATGIDVTGTVTADGLTVSTAGNLTALLDSTAGTSKLQFRSGSGSLSSYIQHGTGGTAKLSFQTNGTTERMVIADNGDISFYEDTGTTPKLFWDSSAESLGIGTTSPNKLLHLAASSGATLRFESTTTGATTGDIFGAIEFETQDASSAGVKAKIDAYSEGGVGNTALRFHTGDTVSLDEAMRIDSSGFISLAGDTDTGWSFPASNQQRWLCGGAETFKTYQIAGAYGVLSVNGSGSATYPNFTFNGDDNTGMFRATTDTLAFSTAGSERMRIDASGNLLLGKTAVNDGVAGHEFFPAGYARITRSEDASLYLNRLSTDGDIAVFRKNGSTVGSIGTTSSRLFIGDRTAGLRFVGDLGWITPWDAGTNAISDDVIDLGATNARFDDIYATNGTIQTSDRNEKQDIEELSEAEQRVAVAAKGLLRKFRWKSKVEEKGDDARIHFGIIAQDLQAAFEAEGLDAGRYAMFIHSTWTDEETGEERSRMGVRYSELLAFIIAAI